jgi:hypothetical protein
VLGPASAPARILQTGVTAYFPPPSKVFVDPVKFHVAVSCSILPVLNSTTVASMPRKMKNKAAAPTEEPPTKRTKLFDEDAVSDDEAVNLTINEDFAKRFEHNKKREEKQKRNSRPSNSASYMSSNVIQSRKSTRTKTLTKTRLPMRMKTMPPN